MSTEISTLKHGTFVKVANLGVLILGNSGSGKSSLALALIDRTGRGIGKIDLPATLVADDQVYLWRDEATGQVYGKAPETIAGMLEVRGIGILRVEHIPFYPVGLIFRICAAKEIERLPDFPNQCLDILGQPIPVIDIASHETTAAAKVRAGVGALIHRDAVENGIIIR